MGRAPCCDKANVKRGPWSPEEDATLRSYLEAHGTAGNWIALPKKAGLRRCGKSCRLRWLNYLRPDIRHGGFTAEEDNIIVGLYNEIGSRWSVIASQLPGRTDNDVKNYWNTKLKKRLFAGEIVQLPPSNIASSSISSTSSVGIDNELVPMEGYSYQGFPVTMGARVEPEMFSTLPTSTHYSPSLKAHGPSPEIGSIIDFSSNSSENSPYSLSMVNENRPFRAPCSGGATGEHGGANVGFGIGFSWDMLINELLFDEKVGEISPYAVAEINPQVLSNQSSINFQY